MNDANARSTKVRSDMATPILRANNLVKSVPTAEGLLTILDGVDVEINSGDAVAVLGQSGSGKTTLLGLLAGLDLPTSGTDTVARQSSIGDHITVVSPNCPYSRNGISSCGACLNLPTLASI